MSIMQIAFRNDVSVSVIENVMKAFDVNYAFLSEYGITMVVDTNDSDLTEYEWALCMLCDMDQEGGI